MEIKLSQLVDGVVGSYTSLGQHEYDRESLEHLDFIAELLDHVISKLCHNAVSGFNTGSSSVIQVGKKSLSILNNIQSKIEDTKYSMR